MPPRRKPRQRANSDSVASNRPKPPSERSYMSMGEAMDTDRFAGDIYQQHRGREPFASSSSGGTKPSSSHSTPTTGIFVPPPSNETEYSTLQRGVAAIKLLDPAKPSIQNSAFEDITVRKLLEERLRLQALALARDRYIRSLKKKIYGKGDGLQAVTALMSARPKIYNSIESAQDKRANHLFLFPDTDPAVYRRKINIPSTFTHQPLYGF